MNIKHMRMSKGLTQEEFANALGVKRNTVSMWETEKANPTADKLLNMAKVLGCSVDDLFNSDADT